MSATLTVAQQAAIERSKMEAQAASLVTGYAGTALKLGNGRVLLDQATGAPVAFVNDDNPQRHYLLDDSVSWHTSDQYWGSGYAITSLGGAQWNKPHQYEVSGGEEHQIFAIIGTGLALDVTRIGGERLVERYEWRNVTNQTVVITGLGIQTPFNDRYPGASKSLHECVNTHIFAGGDWSWVLAKPMNGQGNCLGLVVREGAINAYSIQSRNQVTYSDIRGHIVLQVTDRAINPDSFGGQPSIVLEPGESYVLSWELGWYADEQSFLNDTDAPAAFSSMSATIGQPVTVTTDRTVEAISAGLIVQKTPTGATLTADHAGTYQLALVDGDARAHTEVLFHKSLRDTVNDRARYILKHQVASEREGALAGAIVATDVRNGLHFIDASWNDWSDGSERIAMPVLLQRSLNLGLLDESLRELAQQAADHWRDFAEAELIDGTGAIRRGSGLPKSEFGGRLYDCPWMVSFYTEHYHATHDEHDIDMALKILDRAAEIGGEHFLSIEFAESSAALARVLDGMGRSEDAGRLRSRVVASADYFLKLGSNLPYHEVSYEQSITAPLVSLLLEAHRITGRVEYLDGALERLQWLLSFSGPQPDSRLYGVSIRHWDGYWFGINRQFGDVFPHYWSTLTAEVLARLPQSHRSKETDALAKAIFEANMANYGEDGSATCAYVFPSNVDGRAMHQADPLANDQDWHLNIWMRMIAEEDFPAA
ncbi:hypothetical protein [Bifidobacterium felsineum]|uniref:Six-hairpin glycosidase n=1 Tax=Bifidobacterium felsineum TaxID=2045440 RepID=A0A2M9HIM6_9BIFI|nr:hypothetical protein [Bifidobacterium felsineum]PJM76678.1 hypothetical protein CSQ86_08155 [Bifidobacterium felsineum]